jgi:hypothetical protein
MIPTRCSDRCIIVIMTVVVQPMLDVDSLAAIVWSAGALQPPRRPVSSIIKPQCLGAETSLASACRAKHVIHVDAADVVLFSETVPDVPSDQAARDHGSARSGPVDDASKGRLRPIDRGVGDNRMVRPAKQAATRPDKAPCLSTSVIYFTTATTTTTTSTVDGLLCCSYRALDYPVSVLEQEQRDCRMIVSTLRLAPISQAKVSLAPSVTCEWSLYAMLLATTTCHPYVWPALGLSPSHSLAPLSHKLALPEARYLS